MLESSSALGGLLGYYSRIHTLYKIYQGWLNGNLTWPAGRILTAKSLSQVGGDILLYLSISDLQVDTLDLQVKSIKFIPCIL